MEISVKHLTHIYQPDSPFQSTALEDVSVSIPSGKFITIIGHTGSGKSSLLQHLNGLLKPTKGEVVIGDKTIIAGAKAKDLKGVRQKVGMVFQYPEHQLFEETIEKDIMFGPLNFGCSFEEAKARAKEALKMVNLPEEYLSRSPFDLSGGQMRRVAIAGILAIKPEVLILDEPTAGLDPRGHREILDLFQRLNNEEGLTIIMVTHNMDDAATYSDEIIVMDKGRVVTKDRPEVVFSQVELLQGLGLDIPQTMKFLQALGDKFDYDILTPVFDLEDTAEHIVQFLKKDNG